ncbi:MAG: penicillin acylase family protein [Myxococcota bacterium]
MNLVTRMLSTVLGAVLRTMAKPSLPQTRGEVKLPGLGAPVRAFRDENAVPHVYASNEIDAFRAQGFLHAQDRLFQMDFSRRAARGMLAEIVGPVDAPWEDLTVHLKGATMVDMDHFVRILGLAQAAEESAKTYSETMIARMEAYARGVNDCIAHMGKKLPVEFKVLRYTPEPWTMTDTLVISKLLSLQLSTSMRTILALEGLRERFPEGDRRLRDLFPAYPQDGPVKVRVKHPVPTHGMDLRQILALEQHFREFVGGGGAHLGSNAWAVSGDRSSTGKPILCSDPHLLLLAPSVWYLNHLNAEDEDLNVIGSSLPGAPGVVIGHNARIAWGMTNVMADDADIYIEEVHPEDTRRYRAGNDWVDMEVRQEVYKVKGGREETRDIRTTRHGPVITDTVAGRVCPGIAHEALTLKWTAHAASSDFEAFYQLAHAGNWDDAKEAMRHWGGSPLNMIYADVDGNIGYAMTGRIPLRRAGKGLLPIDGRPAEENEWEGYVPYDLHPNVLNPEEGYVASANNKIVDDSYPFYITDLWEPPYRVMRIREMIESREKHTPDDMGRMHMDVVAVQARAFIRDVLASEDVERWLEDSIIRKAWKILIDWDGACTTDSVASAIWHMFFAVFMERRLKDHLGEDLYWAYMELINQPVIPLENVAREGRAWWFDRPDGHAMELSQTLEEAVDRLREKFGRDMRAWTWGRMHTLVMKHPLGQVPVLAPFFNIGPFETPGDSTTVNNGQFFHAHPWTHEAGPSYRQICDLSDWDASMFVNYTGQSGNPRSPHYRDLTRKWLRGEYVPMRFSKVSSMVNDELVLKP